MGLDYNNLNELLQGRAVGWVPVPYHGGYGWIRETTTTTKEEPEMSVSSKIKELSLNADDKLLREYGVVDDDGDLTCEGKRVLENLLFEENKAAIVAKLKEVKASEKKESK